MQKSLTAILIFLCYISATAQVDTVHNSPQQAKVPDDGKPWWANRDTTKYTSTGYIEAGLGFPYFFSIPTDPEISLSGALPLKNSHFGLIAKLGYNNFSTGNGSPPYLQYYVAGGILLTYQLNHKYAFDVRMLGGFMHINYPENITYSSTAFNSYNNVMRSDSNVNYETDIKPIHTMAVLFQGGIGFRYMIFKNIGLAFNLDYTLYRALSTGQVVSDNYSANVVNYNYVTQAGSTTNYSIAPVYTNSSFIATQEYDFGGRNNIYGSFAIFYQLGNAILIK